MRPTGWWTVASLAALLIGIFAPWAHRGLYSFSGIELPDGKIALALWALAALSAGVALVRHSRALMIIAGILGMLLAATVIYDMTVLEEWAGWGTWLTALAACSLAAAAVATAGTTRRPVAPARRSPGEASDDTLLGYVSEWNRRRDREQRG